LQKAHQSLRADTRRNEAQIRRVAQASARAELAAKEGEAEGRLVALLEQTRAAIAEEDAGSELDRRLLHAQHANAILEIEKIEAEQANVLLEAAVRRHELALRKQALQLELHKRALAAADAFIADHDLAEEWRVALGPLAKLMPSQVAEPSVDDLLAELNAPEPALLALPGGAGPQQAIVSPEAGVDLKAIEDGFAELQKTLGRSAMLLAIEDGKTEEPHTEEASESFAETESDRAEGQDGGGGALEEGVSGHVARSNGGSLASDACKGGTGGAIPRPPQKAAWRGA